MALDLEEQEQLDEFKAWWNKNGKIATNLVLVALVAYSVWVGFNYYQQKKAVEASELFQHLVQLDTTKIGDIKSLSSQLMESYAGTPYAGRAAVFSAKSDYAVSDQKDAKTQLEWAISNSKESSVKAIASLQLASILLEEKNYDEALKVLSGDIDKGYDGLKQGLQGDVYLAQGKQTEAKKAYASALDNLDAEGRLYQYTKQKLEALGS
jgi:predicted negative regulator of RcsB-dependent stress response